MLSHVHVLPLFALPSLLFASPVQHEAKQKWTPPLSPFSLSSWTQGPECKTDVNLLKTISRIQNPPASATHTYTPLQWCSDYLRRTDWSTISATTSAVSTYIDRTVVHLFVTKTDTDHPTSTMYCPIPSAGMECGWDTNTIAPIEQGQDWSIERFLKPEACHQVCLEKKACKAYRIGEDGQCDIFNVGIGQNASNLINPTPGGSQWWDRNCAKHLPTPCSGNVGPCTTAPILTTSQSQPSPTFQDAHDAAPLAHLVTPAPQPTARAIPQIAKRDAPLPPYMSDMVYFWSSIYLAPACTCLIDSVSLRAMATTTRTFTSWTSSTTSSSTYEDWFTVTITQRQTTVYTSVN